MTVPLGDLCRIELGRTPARANARLWDTEMTTNNVWLSISDMPDTLHAVATDSREYVADSAAKDMRLVPEGTLLVSFKLTLGRLCYAGRDLYTNEAIASLLDIDRERLSRAYLYWYLTFFDWDGAAEGDEKVKGKTLNKAKLKLLPVLIPPLDEQKRIVAVLDQALAAVDRARVNAEANLADSEDLLSSFVEGQLGVSGGQEMTLQELMDEGAITGHLDGNHGSEYPRKEEFVSDGVPYISANCIIGQQIDFGRAKYLSAERAARIRKGLAKDQDVIFAHNATVGPVALLSTTFEQVVLGTSVTYYRCNPQIILPEFLMYEMRGAGFRAQYEAVMEQATRSQVPITMQRTFTHRIPSIETQRDIVERFKEMDSASRQLIGRYTKDLDDIAALRQSLLQAAFSGQLT
jgi:type I restriction enzyme S subunit